MKQKLTLTAIVLTILETVCLFIPGSIQGQLWEYQNSFTYHGIATLEVREAWNFFGVYTGMGKPLAILVLAFLLISLAALLLKALKKENIITAYSYFTPIVSFVILVVFTIYACNVRVDQETWRYQWTVDSLYYVIVALHALTILVCMLLQFKKESLVSTLLGSDKKPVVVPGEADELKKYKELLDSGVITQEEFDAKKKQLLGL